jgi:hypothetical protein
LSCGGCLNGESGNLGGMGMGGIEDGGNALFEAK